MGAKGKGKKGAKKGKKSKEEPEPEDEYMKMDGESLEKNMGTLKEKLVDAKLNRNLLQMEKDMIHDFYHNTRAEIKELEARIKNFDTDMQTKEEAHRTELKVFMQKVRHLEYDHGNNQDQVRNKAEKMMESESSYHNEKEQEMLKEKKKRNEEYNRNEFENQGDVAQAEQDSKVDLKALNEGLETSRLDLITKYEVQIEDLRAELDLRMKVEVHEIEERKNQHINELMKAHEDAFKEMKEYYNDITRENLELIRTHRARLQEISKSIESNRILTEQLAKERDTMLVPKKQVEERLTRLKNSLFNFDKDQMGLRNANGALIVLKNKEKQAIKAREQLEKDFKVVEQQKRDMYERFEIAVEQLRSRANVKNQVLDQVLAVRQAELEKKDVQLRELVQRSGLDQATVDEICKKMEEAIEAKNSIIRNLRYSMAHATKAYNDAIRVYEAKLVEFGIPAEELGLELLETQTSDMPAGLVAA